MKSFGKEGSGVRYAKEFSLRVRAVLGGSSFWKMS